MKRLVLKATKSKDLFKAICPTGAVYVRIEEKKDRTILITMYFEEKKK